MAHSFSYAPYSRRQVTGRAIRSPIAERQTGPLTVVQQLQNSVGNHATQRLLESGLLQPKLRIGPVNDGYEREADRTADRVMRMPDPHLDQARPLESPNGQVQRMCSECEEEEKEEESVQRKPRSSRESPATASSESRISSLRGGGQPLPPAARSFFEPRFDHDFSDVRIHTGPSAAEAAQPINARAFTIGRDIVFNAGEYAPHSNSGRRLLAHELTHTIQQKHDIKRQIIQRDLFDDILDGLQVGLDVAGLIPAAGIVPDLINAGVSGLRGDAVGVGLSLAAAIPGAGLAVGVGKLGAKGVKAAKGAKGAKELAEAAAKRAAKEKAAKEAAEKAAKEKAAKETTEKATKEKASKEAAEPKSKKKEKKKDDDTKKKSCRTEYPHLPLCSGLPASYTFPSPQAALIALKIATGKKNLKLTSYAVATSGPCPGLGKHYIVKDGGTKVASIGCCPCCTEGAGRPIRLTKCRII